MGIPTNFLLADTFGNVFLVVAILVIAGIAVGFLKLADKSQKGTVLLLAIALFVLTPFVFPENNDRLLRGAEGILRFSGFVGILIGIYDLIRKRPAK